MITQGYSKNGVLRTTLISMQACKKPLRIYLFQSYLLSLALQRLPRPEEMWHHPDRSTLVGFLKELRGDEGAMRSQRLVVLLTEEAYLFEGGYDETDGCQLGSRVGDLIFETCKTLHREDVNNNNIGFFYSVLENFLSILKTCGLKRRRLLWGIGQ